MAAMDQAVAGARGLNVLREQIAPRFRRIEARRRARAYLAGLLSPVWARPPDHEAARAWSRWRRRHQQRARRSHGKRRTSTKIRP